MATGLIRYVFIAALIKLRPASLVKHAGQTRKIEQPFDNYQKVDYSVKIQPFANTKLQNINI